MPSNVLQPPSSHSTVSRSASVSEMDLAQGVGSKRNRSEIRLNRHREVQERRRIRMRVHFDELREEVVSSYQLIDCCSRSSEEKNPRGFHALAARSDPLTNQDDVLAAAISLMRHYGDMLKNMRRQHQHASTSAEQSVTAAGSTAFSAARDTPTSSATREASPGVPSGDDPRLHASHSHLVDDAAGLTRAATLTTSPSGISSLRSQSERSSNSSRSTTASEARLDVNPASVRSSMQSAGSLGIAVKRQVDDISETAVPNSRQ